MDLMEAIATRHSMRAYKPDPVPQELLRQIMEASLRTPSWANAQPWEFAIVGGRAMEELKEALAQKAASGETPNPDIPWPTFPDLYRDRMRRSGRSLFQELGIARDDTEKRFQWLVSMIRFFDAPNGIILYMDRSLSHYSLLDMGMILQTIILAAWSYELGTCPEVAVVQYPDVLRQLLKIPQSKLIVLGLAIGYPDTEKAAARFRSEREPLETFVTWHGFD